MYATFPQYTIVSFCQGAILVRQSIYQTTDEGLSLFRADGAKKAAAALPSSETLVFLGVWTARQRLSLFTLSALAILDSIAERMDPLKTMFRGRINRKEFWILYIPLLFVSTAALLLISTMYGGVGRSTAVNICLAIVLILGILQAAVIFWRLHDINRSGLNILISAIPFGGFYLLFLFSQKGQPQPNNYGESGTRNSVVANTGIRYLIYLAYILSVPIFVMFFA